MRRARVRLQIARDALEDRPFSTPEQCTGPRVRRSVGRPTRAAPKVALTLRGLWGRPVVRHVLERCAGAVEHGALAGIGLEAADERPRPTTGASFANNVAACFALEAMRVRHGAAMEKDEFVTIGSTRPSQKVGQKKLSRSGERRGEDLCQLDAMENEDRYV
jgi:hypothetical protein